MSADCQMSGPFLHLISSISCDWGLRILYVSDPKTIKTNGNGSIIHRLENRCVLRHISDVYLSWAVLGGQGCREKKFQTAISQRLLN